MSNKSEIQIIAEAVLANARVLEALIAKLPDATKQAVAAEVSKATPAPAAVQVPTPEPVIPEPAPVTVTTSPAMPAVPFPTEPATTPANPVVQAAVAPSGQGAVVQSAAASPSKAPFTDQRGLITYAMNKYKEVGSEKGKQIQVILNGLGINNINEAKPAQYDAIFAGIEGIK